MEASPFCGDGGIVHSFLKEKAKKNLETPVQFRPPQLLFSLQNSFHMEAVLFEWRLFGYAGFFLAVAGEIVYDIFNGEPV